ncbi:MAG: 16S rRNA (cytidine(1402)-2'-O)-methyltransferase, partial [Oscillospiraceae bacterium]|nr:16S rRNA (cytidine(1402)-2'-O)-methyltransferase [Oscillospiraceae bacterium]
FYEAPHKLVATLRDMLEVLGDRKITLVRELTKIHEEVRHTTLAEGLAYYEASPPRGEFVLVLEGASQERAEESLTLEEAADMAAALAQGGMPLSEAAREAARQTGYPKGRIYKEALAKSQD